MLQSTELPDIVELARLEHLVLPLPPRPVPALRHHKVAPATHAGAAVCGSMDSLDMVTSEGVHIIGVPGVDEDEAGNAADWAPGPQAVLVQPGEPGLLPRTTLLPRPSLTSVAGKQVVVGDLVQQLGKRQPSRPMYLCNAKQQLGKHFSKEGWSNLAVLLLGAPAHLTAQ